MVLAGFYKHMVLNELRTLKNEAHYDSDGNDKPESELTEKEDLILQNLVGLPSSKRLRNLTQAQRSIISEIYKTLVFSNYCYGDLLKHCLPIQSVDIEKDHVKKGLKINKVYNKENKKEIFKPPRQLTYGGKIYYFNCHTGI